MENKKNELPVNQDSSQTVKEQLAIVNIKGILIGTITLKQSFKQVLELIQKTSESSTFWINQKDERVHSFDILKTDETDFPLSAWKFPDSVAIQKDVYEDLPF
jgi:sensor histidine kinase YesM